jgi:hypothetical protein
VSEPRLGKLNVKSHEHVSTYQRAVAARWKSLHIESLQAAAESAVDEWLHHSAADAPTLLGIEMFHDAAIVALVGAWRSSCNCLPSLFKTGGSRKCIWSVVYVEKAREFRTLTDIVSMWARQYFKQLILDRLAMSPSLTVIARAAPTLNSNTPEWRRWISFLTARAVLNTLTSMQPFYSLLAQDRVKVMGWA